MLVELVEDSERSASCWCCYKLRRGILTERCVSVRFFDDTKYIYEKGSQSLLLLWASSLGLGKIYGK